MNLTATTPELSSSIIAKPSTRVQSIDLLRGLVMIIMALDHVRDYFHYDAFQFNPLDLTKTSPELFFTRWITHFCAPVFVFLAGTSAYLVGTRKGKKELSMFLLTRGIWLVILEFTVINFAWFFNIHFSIFALTVIWALGMGMIALAAAIHLPYKFILGLGILLVAGHNLLDPIQVSPDNKGGAIVWAILHGFNIFQLDGLLLLVGYALIPWTGIMLLGYCFGKLYGSTFSAASRKKFLLSLGFASIGLFLVLRFINIYGDPNPWQTQTSGVFTLLSFLNVTKYPPSLLYVLITLGPSFLFLAVAEKYQGKISSAVIGLGRVPMFYYIVHLFVIHIAAVFAAIATGFHASDMICNTWVTDSPNLKGYGFSLGVTYIVWIALVLLLFPICLWYDRYKQAHREKWWLSYL